MKIYKVGGSVRDKFLGYSSKDQDWVVVGATPQTLLQAGYTQVGKDFPVFLHPDTHEEYALARTERKTGSGYTGFSVYAASDVTLEDDLQRRDLTINAMATNDQGQLFDPFNGMEDLRNKILRHVSPAFVEDPVRILRIARFAARFDFEIAEETLALMKNMVANGEVDALVPERVWQETVKALTTEKPENFFKILHTCGALERIFPEFSNLEKININTIDAKLFSNLQGIGPKKVFAIIKFCQNNKMIKSIEELKKADGIGQKTVDKIVTCNSINILYLQLARYHTDNSQILFAILMCNLAKNNIEKNIEFIKILCKRCKVPSQYRELAILMARYHKSCQNTAELSPQALHDVLQGLDAFRRTQRFEQFLLACKIYHREDTQEFYYLFKLVNQIKVATVIKDGFQGKEISEELRKRRINIIANRGN